MLLGEGNDIIGLIQEGCLGDFDRSSVGEETPGLVGDQYTIRTLGKHRQPAILVLAPRVQHTNNGLVKQPGAVVRVERIGS